MHAQNLDMLAHIRRELQREGYLKPPKAHLHASCSADAPRLQRIITQLGGELMASESARVLLYHVDPIRQTMHASPCLSPSTRDYVRVGPPHEIMACHVHAHLTWRLGISLL
jgi:hypothetical protein